MIGEEVVNRLSALVDGRIYPDIAPEETPLPRMTYLVVSDNPDFVFSGLNGSGIASVQVDCWAGTQFEAEGLAQKAIPALAESDSGFEVVGATRVASGRDTETGIYRVSYEFDLLI